MQRFLKEFEFEILVMRNVFCVLGFVFFGFLMSCAPAKQVVVVNYGQQAEADFNAGNFDAALTGYENAAIPQQSNFTLRITEVLQTIHSYCYPRDCSL